MAAPRKLRAVAQDETAEPTRALSILEAAEKGDRLEELRSMRRRLAKALDDPNCPPRDMAALSRRQLEIGREIEAMQAKAKQEAEEDGGSTPDEVWDAEAI